ncbi:MAG: hypothetical protein EOO62_21020 [Hymenobacter sp.]|nr:MAG: hypothetical protein EOO62_21020 [Hymenobacter sp.]
MKHNYLVAALLLGALSQSAQAQAQTTAWRPFRPGFVYGFTQPASPTTTHTLRVDSAYTTASGDSVYTFNRLLRPLLTGNTFSHFRSRNNLLGARLRWQSGTSNYYLEANAEPALSGSASPTTLLLKPRAVVGSTWSASTAPALTATLSSRTLSTVAGGTPDSVTTITLSNGQVLLLSRQYGLQAGPAWLTLSTGTTTPPVNWQQAMVPQVGLGSYDPRAIFALNVGDELGYEYSELNPFGLSCYSGSRLRRIVSRQQSADSLLFTYQEQDRIVYVCGTTTVLTPIKQKRWAFSLRTGASPQFPYLGLLTGEYRSVLAPSTFALYMGQGYQAQTSTMACLADTKTQPFLVMYNNTAPYYQMGIDLAYRGYSFAGGLGVGLWRSFDSDYTNLTYYKKGNSTCGSPANFTTLLPSRAAQAAAAATLHPNPATEAATLTLAAPTMPGSTVALTDALGRRVWSTDLAPGQMAIQVPLAGQAGGLYLVQLLVPNAAPLTWKLTKQ